MENTTETTEGPLPPGEYKSKGGRLLFVQEDGQVHGKGFWQSEPFNPMWHLLHDYGPFTLIETMEF